MRPNLTDPQLGPALAMVALLRENPDLPRPQWQMSDTGYLWATVYTPAALDAWRAVLGGKPTEPHYYDYQGTARVSVNLTAEWRDVKITVVGVYDADVYHAAAGMSGVAA